MHQVAFIRAAQLACAHGIFLTVLGAHAQATQFTSASDCRMQWDDEFESYAQQYKKCGPECWSGDVRRHEYLRYSDWLTRLEKWHDYCRAMSGAELHLGGDDAQSSPAWTVALQTEGQSSCELIRSGEVRYRFRWHDRRGRTCYSNAGVRRNAAACCP